MQEICHVICGESEEEGYGKLVTCYKCLGNSSDQTQVTSVKDHITRSSEKDTASSSTKKKRKIRNDAEWLAPKSNMQDNKYQTVIELVGLDLGAAGRSCERHEVCGTAITLNNIIILRAGCVTGPDMDIHEVVEAHKVANGTQTCLVGFLARRFLRTKRHYINQMYQVVNDYSGLQKLRNSLQRQKLRNAGFNVVTKVKEHWCTKVKELLLETQTLHRVFCNSSCKYDF